MPGKKHWEPIVNVAKNNTNCQNLCVPLFYQDLCYYVCKFCFSVIFDHFDILLKLWYCCLHFDIAAYTLCLFCEHSVSLLFRPLWYCCWHFDISAYTLILLLKLCVCFVYILFLCYLRSLWYCCLLFDIAAYALIFLLTLWYFCLNFDISA